MDISSIGRWRTSRVRPIERMRVRRSGRRRAAAADAECLAEPSPKNITLRICSRAWARLVHRRRQELVDRHAALQLPVHRAEVLPGARRQDRRTGEGRGVSVAHDRFLELHRGGRRPATYVLGGAFNCGKGQPGQIAPVTHGCPRPCSVRSTSSTPPGGGLTLQETIDRVLRLSKADACIVIARRVATVNVRWAHNTVTTNGDGDEVSLSVISIAGRRVAGVTRTHFPAEQLEAIVRESEAACARRPEAPDYMPLSRLGRAGQMARTARRCGHPRVRSAGAAIVDLYEQARRAGIRTFGYAELRSETTLVATSTGLKKRHSERIGKVEITAKTPDFRVRRGSAR